MVNVIIYLIGMVITYYYFREKNSDGSLVESWGDIIYTFIVSLSSWFGVLIMLLIELMKLSINDDNKPPKWL